MTKKYDIIGKTKKFFEGALGDILLIIVIIFVCIPLLLYFLGPDVFGVGSNVLQYVTVALSFVAWINTRRILVKRKELRVEATGGDMILMVDIGNGSVEGSVCRYVNGGNLQLGNITDINPGGANNVILDEKYVKLSFSNDVKGALLIQSGRMPAEDKVDDFMKDYQMCIEKAREIMSQGNRQKIHLFIGAPVEMSAFIMPYFVNKNPIIIYRYNFDKNSYYRLGQVDNRNEST